MKVLFVCNDIAAFKAHRSNLVDGLLKGGHEVHVCAGGYEFDNPIGIDERVFEHPTQLNQHRLSVISDFKLLLKIRRLFGEIKPDVLHSITIKPNLFASLALKSSFKNSLKCHVLTFPGLGKVFEPSDDFFKTVRRYLVMAVLRFTTRGRNSFATFENPFDRDLMVETKMFLPDQAKAFLGAGINLDQFKQGPKRSSKNLKFLSASRLLHAKGVGEFIWAANECHKLYPNTEFKIAGDYDSENQDCFEIDALIKQDKLGIVEYVGSVENDKMPKLFEKTDVVCQFTKLREGFPRVLIEAAACGCALIGSDQTSIRQIIKEGETGWLVDPFDKKSILDAMLDSAKNHAKTRALGDSAAKFSRSMPIEDEDIYEQFSALYEAGEKV